MVQKADTLTGNASNLECLQSFSIARIQNKQFLPAVFARYGCVTLSVTPAIPPQRPLLDNNDSVAKLSGRHFPSKKKQKKREGASPCPHK